MTAPASPALPRPNRRRLWFLLGAVGVLLAVALIVALIVWRGGAGLPGDPGTAGRPQPSETPAPVALAGAATPVPTASPTGPRPSQCDELYSPSMVAAFGDAVLNPAWAEAEDSGVRHGTLDPELVSVIDANDKLTCVWGSPAGGSGSGLTTNLVWLTTEQAAAVKARLGAAGMTCYDELGGFRCLADIPLGEEGIAGESHFLRDGIWLATHYVNAGPDGYTHDIIANLWDGA